MKHYTIPVFIPELACPNRCVFCNQHSISGRVVQPEPEEAEEIIRRHLATIPREGSHIEIGFFGGSFTGIEPDLQERFLEIAHSHLIAGRVQGIRLSTRPDYIDAEILSRLKSYGVTTIELGAQSLHDDVLKLAGRGHTVADVERAALQIRNAGFRLGLQMMTGLPGDTPEKSMETARRIAALKADCTRIYPTLVIRGTDLEKLWQTGKYSPQSLEQAVELAAQLLRFFREAGVEVIRTGLHPSEELTEGSDLLAGPFHPNFRELAETRIWKSRLEPLMQQHPSGSAITIPVPAAELPYAIGYKASNRIMLENHFSRVEFVPETDEQLLKPLIVLDKRAPLPVKNALKALGNLHLLQTEGLTYKSISGHPDVFICHDASTAVVAPALPAGIASALEQYGIRLIRGTQNPEKRYPGSARYNAVVTPDYLIHNLKITDPAIFEAFPGRRQLHVNQGYTRCNLLPLGNNRFITSDRGIEKALLSEGLQTLYVDPTPVKLHGQKHGFFPGCCGILGKQIFICGSLAHHPQAEEVRAFVHEAGFTVKELFDGVLTDVGGILILEFGL